MGAPMLLAAALAVAISAHGPAAFDADPASAALRSLAQPSALDEARYGCGPIREPRQTYYVSIAGDDARDGLSWGTAWRSIHRGVRALRAGDTLLIGEGEYAEPQIEINVRTPQEGAPGRPIRIMAAPRHRVVVTGAPLIAGFRRASTDPHIYVTDLGHSGFQTVWEADTTIELQRVPSLSLVAELPGTFWHDVAGRGLYVRFSDSRGPAEHGGVRLMLSTEAAKASRVPGAYVEGLGTLNRPRDVRSAIRIHGSYIHLEGLWFKHHCESIVVSSNASFRTGKMPANSRVPFGGHHNTIEDCKFFSTENVGILVTVGARWNLIKGNTSVRGGASGGIMSQSSSDNLFAGNRVFPSTPTVRARGSRIRAAINHYGGGHAPRNHIVGNLLIDAPLSLMWKPASPGAVFEGNVAINGIACTGTRRFGPGERVVVRNNILGSQLSWQGEPLGPGGVHGDWAGPDKAYLNNLYVGKPGSTAFEEARFADPAYQDYRLQSDSPWRGAGVAGFSRGAFAVQDTRVLYVSPSGDDAASGTGARQALGSLAKATAMLRAGDTLYIMAGEYAEPLRLDASGTVDRPIRVRAYGKSKVLVSAIDVNGSNVIVEHVTVHGADADGARVRGADVELTGCLIDGCQRAGVRGVGARGLSLLNCTLVGNEWGLALEAHSTGATIRDSIIAANRGGAAAVSGDSQTGYVAGHNCYFGRGVDDGDVSREVGSVSADPLFVAPSEGDFRLRWDSPAATIAGFALHAGARPVIPKAPEIADVRVVALRSQSACIRWQTPVDDTTGYVQYRKAGARAWRRVEDPTQGTIHGAGLAGLGAGAGYEFRVQAVGRRGGGAASHAGAFTTPATDFKPRVLYLSPDGDDAHDGLSLWAAWRSMRRASSEAGPGDTVLVAAGVYHHPIVPLGRGQPDQRLTFRKHGPGEAVIDAGGFRAPLVKIYSRHYVTVDGFTLVNLPGDGRGGVIRIVGGRGVEILNCRTDRVPRDCGDMLSASNCQDLRIEGNRFWGAGCHLRFHSGCSNVLVRGNTVVQCNFYHATVYGPVHGIRFEHNLWYLPCSPRKNNGNYLIRGNVTGFSSDRNVFFSPYPHQRRIGVFQADGRRVLSVCEDLDAWREKTGHDKHSLWADPLFVDWKQGDFRLRPGSPAASLRAGWPGARDATDTRATAKENAH